MPRHIVLLGLALFVLGPSLPPAARAGPVDSVGLPDPARSMRAYAAVEAAVRGWSNPPRQLAAPDGSAIGAVWGARVALRLDGKLIGTGARFAAPGAAEPDQDLLAAATSEAIAASDRRLPLPNDIMRADSAKALAADVQVSLEIASRPGPIAGDTWSEVDFQLNPGLDGLIVRLANPAEGAPEPLIKFPSELMALSVTPQKALRGMIATIIGEGGAAAVLMPPGDIRARHGVVVERFRVVHLAQCAPRSSARFLFRGASLRIDAPLAISDIRSMADGLAANLMRRWSDEQTRSPKFTTYLASEGRFQEGDSSGQSLLLAALALSEYRSLPLDANLQVSVDDTLAKMQQTCPFPETGVEWSMQAMIHWPPNNLVPKGSSLTTERAAAAIRDSAKEAATGQAPDTTGWDAQTLSRYQATRFASQEPPAQALLLSAMAKSRTDDPGSLRTCLGQVLAATKPEQLVGLTPWIGWAAVDAFTADNGQKSDIPAAVALRQMRSLCWKHQLTSTDAGEDAADMVGGIVFTSGTQTPLPTWQSLRPLAFLATMLGDDRLTEPAERPLELARLLQSLRFVRQLQVDDSCGWLYPQPSAAIGGLRAAAWDHSMPPDATSFALLTVCHSLNSLESLAKAASTSPSEPSETPRNPPQTGP